TLTFAAGARVNNASALTITGRVVNNGTVSGGGSLTIGSGGTLGGSGAVNQPTTINPGGHLSPGNSPGTITVGGGLTLDGDYDWELNGNTTAGPGTNFDQLIASGGTTTIGAGSFFTVIPLGGVNFTDPFWTAPHSWAVLNQTSGTLSGSFGSVANGAYPQG